MTSNSALSARDVVEQLFATMPSQDADAFAALMAEDVVFEMPFVVPGMPDRLEGRRAVRDHLAQRWGVRHPDLQVHGIEPRIYETTDPEIVLVENDVDLTPPGGERIKFRGSVNVIQVCDGKVVVFRDYMDTARMAGMTTR